jgi:hypothetical protein
MAVQDHRSFAFISRDDDNTAVMLVLGMPERCRRVFEITGLTGLDHVFEIVG